jgi:hypothetical protein
MHQPLMFAVCGALLGASAPLVVGTGGEAGASEPSPVQVTCTNLNGGSGSLTLSGCDDHRDSGGGGVMQISEGINGSVTISVTWNSGLTTVEPVTEGRVLNGAGDRCQPPRGYTNDSEAKFKGTVTGGTASDLVGGAAKSTICGFSKSNNSNTLLVENKPHTYVTF